MKFRRVFTFVASPRRLIRALRYRNRPPRYRALRRVVQEVRPTTILEIGLFHGDTARMLIETACHAGPVQYWGLDLFAEGMTEDVLVAEVSKQPLPIDDVRARLSDLPARVTLVAGDSTQTLPTLDLPPIDFVFIDGGHSYDTVAADWMNVRKILADGATVVFDDYTNGAAVTHEGFGVRRLVDEMSNDWKVEFLKPVDRFDRPWGALETQLVRVERLSSDR